MKILGRLFFPAKKNTITSINPNRHYVKGEPEHPKPLEYDYNPLIKDFLFKTYKEVIAGGLIYTRQLLSNKASNLSVYKLHVGRKKQWFNAQLIDFNEDFKIDGEKFHPFLNIKYSYNHPTTMKFEIGWYRYACENGMLLDMDKLVTLKVNSENLFTPPAWFNRCLLEMLKTNLETDIRILKQTKINQNDAEQFLQKRLKWIINPDVISRNFEILGQNAFAMFNVITEVATHGPSGLNNNLLKERDTISNEKFDYRDELEYLESKSISSNQKIAGKIFNELIEEIRSQNNLDDRVEIDINNPEFELNDENLDQILKTHVPENLRLNISDIFN